MRTVAPAHRLRPMNAYPFLLFAALACAACAGVAPGKPAAGNPPLRIRTGPAATVAEQHYAGSAVCAGCHAVRFRRWAASVHSGSMETLRKERDGGETSCLRCHATGFGTGTGHGGTRPGEGLSAVTCEACHGPSGEHAASRFPALVRTPGSSECGSCEVARICRECHTPRHSPSFDLQVFLRRIACSAEQSDR